MNFVGLYFFSFRIVLAPVHKNKPHECDFKIYIEKNRTFNGSVSILLCLVIALKNYRKCSFGVLVNRCNIFTAVIVINFSAAALNRKL